MLDQQSGDAPGAHPPGRPDRSDLVLRRFLVDENFMQREQGVYWRTGGTVDVDDPSGRGPGGAGPA